VAAAVEAMGATAGVVFRPVIGLEPLDFWVARRAGDERRPVLDFVAATVDAEVFDDNSLPALGLRTR